MRVGIGVGTRVLFISLAIRVYFDARRSGRAAWSNAIATVVLGPLALAVYLGTRAAANRNEGDTLDAAGSRLLREMTAEVQRPRSDLAAAQARITELEEDRAARGCSPPAA
jgi:hypothetical protein